jgi:TIR domain
MADIFISYSKGSAAQTQQLAKELQGKGFTVWYDTSLVPGDSFRVLPESSENCSRRSLRISRKRNRVSKPLQTTRKMFSQCLALHSLMAQSQGRDPRIESRRDVATDASAQLPLRMNSATCSIMHLRRVESLCSRRRLLRVDDDSFLFAPAVIRQEARSAATASPHPPQL